MSKTINEFVIRKLPHFTECTIICTQFANLLLAHHLVTETEHQRLRLLVPNIDRSTELYLTVSKKWSSGQWDDYMKVLDQTGNHGVLELLRQNFSEFFQNHHFKGFKENFTAQEVEWLFKVKKKEGMLEGYSYEEEIEANRILEEIRQLHFEEDSFLFSSGHDERTKSIFIAAVKSIVKKLKNGLIWWNPRKNKNYLGLLIPRYVQKYCCNNLSSGNITKRTLLEVAQNSPQNMCILLNEPGMGKTSEMLQLEVKLRMNIAKDRIVTYINLPDVQTKLIRGCQDCWSMLATIVPFIPNLEQKVSKIQVFLLLDSADEVCPMHEDGLTCFLGIVSNIPNLKVILATRPQPGNLVQTFPDVSLWSLLPVSSDGQLRIMRNRMAMADLNWNIVNQIWPNSIRTALTNPQVLGFTMKIIKETCKPDIKNINLFDLMEKLVDLHYEKFLIKKLKMQKGANSTVLVKNSMSVRNLDFFYHIVKEQFQQVAKIVDENFQKPQNEAITAEITTNGLLVAKQGNLNFMHKTFTEFFCAKLLKHTNTQIPGDLTNDTVKYFYEAHSDQTQQGNKNVSCHIIGFI